MAVRCDVETAGGKAVRLPKEDYVVSVQPFLQKIASPVACRTRLLGVFYAGYALETLQELLRGIPSSFDVVLPICEQIIHNFVVWGLFRRLAVFTAAQSLCFQRFGYRQKQAATISLNGLLENILSTEIL